MVRVRNVLRRSLPPSDGAAGVAIRVGALRVDPARHEAFWREAELELTAQEFNLLHTLALHAGQVMTREQLLAQVWGYDYYGDLRVVDAAVKRLRAKLRRAAPGFDLITTVRGVGYRLAA